MEDRSRALRSASRLCAATVTWNAAAGTAAVVVGLTTRTLALLGLGLDSAVDGLASAVLVWRLRAELQGHPDPAGPEQRAARVVGTALVAIGVYLAIRSIASLVSGTRADVTGIGIAIAAGSVVVLPPLAVGKGRRARELASGALRGDAFLTAAGAVLAATALAGLLADEAFGWPWADPIAASVIALALLAEGTRTLRPGVAPPI